MISSKNQRPEKLSGKTPKIRERDVEKSERFSS
jgi:hypothetical protein